MSKATVRKAYMTTSGYFGLSGTVVAGWAVVIDNKIVADGIYQEVFKLKSAALKQAEYLNK